MNLLLTALERILDILLHVINLSLARRELLLSIYSREVWLPQRELRKEVSVGSKGSFYVTFFPCFKTPTSERSHVFNLDLKTNKGWQIFLLNFRACYDLDLNCSTKVLS